MSVALKDTMTSTQDPIKAFLATIEPTKAMDVRAIAERFYSYVTESSVYADLPKNEMLAVRDAIRSGTPWREAIFALTQKQNHAWLEKIVLSPSRSLILDLLDFRAINVALDLGSGWGQLTQYLAHNVGLVVSVELGLERLEVNNAICIQEDLKNTVFLHADVLTLPFKNQMFDLVVLDGVLEWLGAGKTELPLLVQSRALRNIYSLLSSSGCLLIAIENRCGLKYILGENDDHIRMPYTNTLPFAEASALYFSQTGKPLQARTHSIAEYRKLLHEAGFNHVDFYAAFPDYKLPELLVPLSSPAALTQAVSSLTLPEEHDGSDGSPSKNAEILRRGYRALNDLEIVGSLAPSFIILARKS